VSVRLEADIVQHGACMRYLTLLPISKVITSVVGEWTSTRHLWNDNDGRKLKYSEYTCPIATYIPRIPCGLAWDWIWACTVGDQQHTACTMVWWWNLVTQKNYSCYQSWIYVPTVNGSHSRFAEESHLGCGFVSLGV